MKRIGGRIYLHASSSKLLSSTLYAETTRALRVASELLGEFNWNCIRIKPDSVGGADEIAFQWSPDFLTAPEPQVVQTIRCIWNNVLDIWEVKDMRVHKNLIWHHKWMWVTPDFKGFDYEASKRRSATWKPHVNKSELTKIGNKVYWESIKERWEQCK
jgi:hypothetical protein